MMKGISFSSFQTNIEFNRVMPPITIVNPTPSRFYRPAPRWFIRVLSLSVDSSANRNAKSPFDSHAPPLVVVGSANADIYVEIDRLPKEGETISAKTGQALAGGKRRESSRLWSEASLSDLSPVRLVAAGFGVSGSVNENSCCSFCRRCRILYRDRRFYRLQPQGRTRRSDAASDAASCINETNKSWHRMLTLPLPLVPAATKRTVLKPYEPQQVSALWFNITGQIVKQGRNRCLALVLSNWDCFKLRACKLQLFQHLCSLVAIPWDSSSSWHFVPTISAFFEPSLKNCSIGCTINVHEIGIQMLVYLNIKTFVFLKKNIKTFVPAYIVGYVLKGRLMKLSPQMWYPTCRQSLKVHPTDMQWIMSIVPCIMGFIKIRLSNGYVAYSDSWK